ncbi:class A beta-lactamase-related serine hydrolase (plasmid) [Rhizobium rosettiformans]|uniref:beta-lactamase n=1 Tax=Rhizobium rosettiformans TaxID=1368430 RepID=A0ABX7F3J8_9HYPH|nr:serine hydrolase [Rhizobium rosettiformans]QRF54168.1 class A beta-lactamase-related serine hydrolase [Rhizobium rosettiformans]
MTTSDTLNAICDAQPFVTRFMVRNLLTGEEIARGADEETPSGSTRKTSIMMAALKAAHEGRINLDEPVTYEKRLAEQVASGMFRFMTPGIVISLRDAITGMMVLSDNVCTKMVLERLTLNEVDSYCKAVGMANTHHRFLIPPLALPADHALTTVTTTSAADQVLLLQTILDAQSSSQAQEKLGCSADLCGFAMETLKNQVLRYGIRSRLPFETLVASKSGRGKRGRMDAGIVYKDRAPFFIITAYTDDVPQVMPDGTPGYTVSLETIGRLAETAWNCFQS